MKPKEERLEKQNALLAHHEEIKALLLKLPNVIDVGIGLKETSDTLTEEIVFQIFVEEKVSEDSLKPSERIPKEIKGFKTDVVKVPKSRKRKDSSEHRPIKGGVQIGNGKGHVGTLGCFARLTANDSLVLLSNEHVLYSDNAKVGDKIGQSNIDNHCCCCCAYITGEIGTVLGPAFDNTTVDCGIASIDSGVAIDLTLNNRMTNTEIPIRGIDTAVVGDLVRKIGRTSGFTNGIINSITGRTGPTSDDKSGQIFIRPVPSETYTEKTNGKKAFSDGGDSGSVVLDADNKIVGLLWGGDPDSFAVDETYACHIHDVLDAFRNAGSEIKIELTPPSRSSLSNNQPLRAHRLDFDIRERLMETEKGKTLITLVEIHQKEIIHLINNIRQVKIAWHRHQGPTFVAHLMKSYMEENYKVPEKVSEISIQQLLMKMATVLKDTASVALKNDIDCHALWLIQETYGIYTIEEFILKLEDSKVILA